MFVSKSVVHYLFLVAFFARFANYQEETQTTSGKTSCHGNLFVVVTMEMFVDFSFLLCHPAKFQFSRSPQLMTDQYIENILNNKVFLNQAFELNLCVSRMHFKTQNTPPNFSLVFSLPSCDFWPLVSVSIPTVFEFYPGVHSWNRLSQQLSFDFCIGSVHKVSNLFSVSVSIGTSPFDMTASVTSPSGLTELCDIVSLDDNHYSIKFVPKEMGVHTVSVKHKDMHIPGKVKVISTKHVNYMYWLSGRSWH